MNTNPGTRSQQIDFAAHCGRLYLMSGDDVRLLQRLSYRWRRDVDIGKDRERLREAIELAAPEGAALGFGSTVAIDGMPVL